MSCCQTLADKIFCRSSRKNKKNILVTSTNDGDDNDNVQKEGTKLDDATKNSTVNENSVNVNNMNAYYDPKQSADNELLKQSNVVVSATLNFPRLCGRNDVFSDDDDIDENEFLDAGIIAEEKEPDEIVNIQIDTSSAPPSPSPSRKEQVVAPVSPMSFNGSLYGKDNTTDNHKNDNNLPPQPSPSQSPSPSPSIKKQNRNSRQKTKSKTLKSTTKSSSSSLSASNNPIEGLDYELCQKLSTAVPDATEAEIKRFLIARKGDYDGALDQLRSYISWRKKCNLDNDDDEDYDDGGDNIDILISPTSANDDGFISCASSVGAQDRDDWISASKAALVYCKEYKDDLDDEDGNDNSNYNGNKWNNSNEKNNSIRERKLPQIAHMVTGIKSDTYMKDKEGDRILQLLPAQIDVNEADEITYAFAIAFYVDKKLSRNSMEKIVVSVDVRAGEGWANPPAKKIVPFIKNVVSLLERNFPERLSRCILYPLPTAATLLWKMIRIFLDPNTASKMIVVSGSAGIRDTISPKKLEKILDKSVHTRMEEIRRDSFVTKTNERNIV